jgi:hypothetical protein
MPFTDPFFNPGGTSPQAPPAREDELRGGASRPTLEGYDLQRVIAESSVAIVYAALDLGLRTSVAIKEYLPQRLARRHSASLVVPMPAQSAPYERGLQVFIDEARTLARCDHPSLLRVTRLIEANGTAYRAMPCHEGERLVDVRRRRGVPPAEPMLRAWLEALLGALEAYHAVARVHGRVTPDNILLLPDDRPMLLGPGTVGDALDADRREAGFREALALERDAADDVHQLARTACFCITGHGSPERGRADDEPLRAALDRMQLGGYDPALLDALEAAASPHVARRPASIDAFREWLVLGPPALRASAAPPVAAPRRADAPPFDVTPERVGDSAAASGWHADLFDERAFSAPRFDAQHGSREADATEPLLHDTEPLVGDTQPLLHDTQPMLEDPSFEAASAGDSRTAGGSRRRGRMRTWLLPGAALLLLLGGAVAWVVTQQPVHVEGWTRDQVLPGVPDLTPRDRSAMARPENAPSTPLAPKVEATSSSERAAPPAPTPTEASPPAPASREPSLPGATAMDPSPSIATTRADPASPATVAPRKPADAAPTDAPGDRDAIAAVLPHAAGATTAPSQASTPTRAAPAHATEARGTAPHATASHATTARAPASSKASPAEACSGRTPFARYRCIETQCAQARWSAHPQCVRFRRTGDVD